MKYDKCKHCYYNKRRVNIFPCNVCEKDKQEPLTCLHCRKYPCKGERQSVKPCKSFEWD